MQKITRSLIVLSAITFFAFLPLSSEAYTKTKLSVEPKNDFVVEPGKTEIILNPGETVVKNVTITNRSEKTVKFKLTAEDFVGTENSEQPVVLLGDTNSPYSLKDFIIPEISEFSLEFGEQITIPVSISVPKNVEPRGYYGALIVSNDPDKLGGENGKETEGKTRIVSRIGSLFLLKINGIGKFEGELEDFKVIGPNQIFYSERPTGFEIAFKNTGNVHLVPYGMVTIKNMFGQKIETLPVNAYFVLPNSIRNREIMWSDGFSLGRYTANLSLYKGYGEENIETKIAFYIIPWKILIPTFIIIVLLVSIVYYVMTRFELKRK